MWFIHAVILDDARELGKSQDYHRAGGAMLKGRVTMGWITKKEIILCMRPDNDRRRYNVTSSLIVWSHAWI